MNCQSAYPCVLWQKSTLGLGNKDRDILLSETKIQSSHVEVGICIK